MLNVNSSLTHLYPSKYKIDLINKKKYWMGTRITFSRNRFNKVNYKKIL